MRAMPPRTLTRKQIWGAPIALGVATVVGLVAALLADGAGDAASWGALGVPVVVAIWFAMRPARSS